MSLSNYAEAAILNYFFRTAAVTRPTAWYIALYKSDPTDDNTGTEVSGGGYARRSVTFNAPAQVDGKGQIANSAIVEFPEATADWGEVTHFGVFDALTGGNLLGSGQLKTSRIYLTGDMPKFKAGEVKVDLD